MEEVNELAGRVDALNPTILMWIAIGLGVVFVGVMILDYLRRKKRHDRYRTRHGGLRRVLTRPFRRARSLWHAIKDLRRRRDQHKRREEPSHHRTSSGGRGLRVRSRYRPG